MRIFYIALILGLITGCSLMLIHGDGNTVIDQTKEGIIVENDK